MIRVLSKIVVWENNVVKHSAMQPQKEHRKGAIDWNDSMGWVQVG